MLLLEVYVEVVAAAAIFVVVVNCNSMRKRQRAITASWLKSLDNYIAGNRLASGANCPRAALKILGHKTEQVLDSLNA